MIKFVNINIKGSTSKNDLNIIIDNEDYQEYQTLSKELILDLEFGNTLVDTIYLRISPAPEHDIQFKLYNLNEFDNACDIYKGKLILERKDQFYQSFTQFIHKQLPYTHMQLVICSEKYDSFKIFFVGLEGQRIFDEEEKQSQLLDQTKQQLKTLKQIYKPGRSEQNAPSICLPNPQSFEEFVQKVKQGKSINPGENITTINKVIRNNAELEIEEPLQYQTFQQTDIHQNNDMKLITIEDEDDNSVQFLGQKNNMIQQHSNENVSMKSSQQPCLSSESKQYESLFSRKSQINSQSSTQKQSNITKYLIKNGSYNKSNNDQIIVNYMIKYDASQIDEQFLQFHQQSKILNYIFLVELARGVKGKFRLKRRMFSEY